MLICPITISLILFIRIIFRYFRRSSFILIPWPYTGTFFSTPFFRQYFLKNLFLPHTYLLLYFRDLSIRRLLVRFTFLTSFPVNAVSLFVLLSSFATKNFHFSLDSFEGYLFYLWLVSLLHGLIRSSLICLLAYVSIVYLLFQFLPGLFQFWFLRNGDVIINVVMLILKWFGFQYCVFQFV